MFFLLDATASPACLVAATALPVALPFMGLVLWASAAVCFPHVPMGAAMLSAAMLAAFIFLHTVFLSMTTGLEERFEGFRACCL